MLLRSESLDRLLARVSKSALILTVVSARWMMVFVRSLGVREFTEQERSDCTPESQTSKLHIQNPTLLRAVALLLFCNSFSPSVSLTAVVVTESLKPRWEWKPTQLLINEVDRETFAIKRTSNGTKLCPNLKSLRFLLVPSFRGEEIGKVHRRGAEDAKEAQRQLE